MKKITACDVLAEAKRKYSNPTRLTKDECDYLVDELFEMVNELHGMAERMEARLHDYHSFVESFRDAATGLLDS